MVCLMFTSLLLGLSLSLVALGDSTTFAHQCAASELANNGHAIEANKEVQADAASTSKWLKGRKMGAVESPKKKKKKKKDPSSKDEETDQKDGSSPRNIKTEGSALEAQKHQDREMVSSTNGLYNLQDYRHSGRKRPIHN